MRRKFLVVVFILVAAVFLSGCTGAVAWPGLATDGQMVYLANGPFVHALDAKDGREQWHYPQQADSKLVFYSTPVLTPEGLVILGSSGINHSLFAIDPQKFPDTMPPPVGGVQRFLCSIGLSICPETLKVEEWVFSGARDHWVAAPLVWNGKLFAPNADGNLYVLDLKDGSLIKKITLSGESNRPNRLWSQPVADSGRVFIASLDHSVVAIDMENYEIIWREDLGGAIPGGIAMGSDGMLYVGSFAKQLERFDPATGDHQSVVDTKDWIWGTPVASGDNLYFSDIEGNFYSYNAKEAKLNWNSVKPDSAITSSPLAQEIRVLVATESGNVYSVNDEGKFTLWSESPGGKAYTTPVTGGGFVFVAYLEANYVLAALDENGKPAWTYPAQQ